VREATGWSDFQVKTHMAKLTDLEYLLAHRGGRGQCFEYELLYDGDGSIGPHLSGLLDVASLGEHAYDDDKEHSEAGKEDSSSPQGGIKSAPKCAGQSPEEPHAMGVSRCLPEPVPKMPVHRGNGKRPSYAPLPLAAGVAQ
jgi:hypothetical protein